MDNLKIFTILFKILLNILKIHIQKFYILLKKKFVKKFFFIKFLTLKI